MAFNPDKCMKIVADKDTTISIERAADLPDTITPILSSKTGEADTWEAASTIELLEGEFVYLKGTGPTSTSNMKYTRITASNDFHVEGQITSLLNDGEGGDVALTETYCFGGLFFNSEHLISVPEDFLPSTTLSAYCYYGLFNSAVNLQTPKPIYLPATELADNCYWTMFRKDSKVDKIKVEFTAWGSTPNWVDGVASTGTFYCPKELEQIFDGSHIPEGWKPVSPYILKSTFSISFLNKVKIGGRVK